MRSLVATLGLGLVAACASSAPEPGTAGTERSRAAPGRSAIVRAAQRVVGVPYRYGGSSPSSGFDCSGLVVYSYRKAGHAGLPHSASALYRRARPVALDKLRPGDLLFFRLGGKKVVHVGIYVGDGSFIHAPSSGKHVERVRFDHPYWSARLRLAGRIVRR